MLFIVNRWFEQVAASRDYRGSDYLLLVIILSVGTFLRFWGLGNVGLHGDEETMAMPAMSILESGQPLLPSGMFYPRALLNIYLMSGSVWMFGESEWVVTVCAEPLFATKWIVPRLHQFYAPSISDNRLTDRPGGVFLG